MIVLLRFQGQNAQAIFESLIANYYFAIFGLDYICQSGTTISHYHGLDIF